MEPEIEAFGLKIGSSQGLKATPKEFLVVVGFRGAAVVLALVLAGCLSGNSPSKPSSPSGGAASSWQPSAVVSLNTSAGPMPHADIQWLGDGATRNLEPSLAVDPLDARHLLVAWTLRGRVVSPAGATTGASAEVLAAQSLDGGETWNQTALHDPGPAPVVGAYPMAYDERVAFLPDGTAVVVYVDDVEYANSVRPMSRITIALSKEGGPWSYHAVAETMTDVWDFTALAVASDSGHLYVATGGFISNTVPFWRSTDQGATWEGPVDPFSPLAAGPGLKSSIGVLALNPSIAALPGGVVVLSARATLLPQSDGTVQQMTVASHDDGRTFEPPHLVAAGSVAKLVSENIGSAPGTNLARSVVADSQGAIVLTESDNAGDSWSEPKPLGQNGDSIPYWAVFDSGTNGALDALVRSGDTKAPLHVSLFSREPAGATRGFELAQAGRIPQGTSGDNRTDDYGGIAITSNGVVYAAFADPRDVTSTRIAVVRLQGLAGS